MGEEQTREEKRNAWDKRENGKERGSFAIINREMNEEKAAMGGGNANDTQEKKNSD